MNNAIGIRMAGPLVKDRKAAKTRKSTVTQGLLRRQLAKRLHQIGCDIAKIDAAKLELAYKDQHIIERLKNLESAPGSGKVTALTILVDMPEIGALRSKQVASLVGLAPM